MSHTTTIDNKFTVTSVDFNATAGQLLSSERSSVDLTLVPVSGYELDAADFSANSNDFPTGVSAVSFAQSGANVIATVTFDTGYTMPSNAIDLPICISGRATLISFTLSGSVIITSDANITPASGVSTFSATGNEGDTVTAFTKTISANTGYKLNPLPVGTLAYGDPNKFNITTSSTTDESGNVTDYTFTGTYTFGGATETNNQFTILASSELIYIPPIEITSYTINTANIPSDGTDALRTRTMTIIGTPNANFTISVLDNSNNTPSGVPSGQQVMPGSGSYSFNIIFPEVTSLEEYDFLLTGDGVSDNFGGAGQQPSSFTIYQYPNIDVSFGVTATGALANNITLPNNVVYTYKPNRVLNTSDQNYEFIANLIVTAASAIVEGSAPQISDLTNLNSATNGGTDITISSLTTSLSSDNLTYTVSISGTTNETGTLDVLSQLNLNNFIDINATPVASGQTISLNKGASTTITLSATDGDGDTLTYYISALPANGTLYSDSGLTTAITATGAISGNVVYYEHDDSSNLTDSINFYANDGYVNSNTATVNLSIGVPVGQSISASGSGGIYYIPITIGTEAGEFKAHFDASDIPDRFEILYDTSNTSNSLADMEVVADSLFVGDYVLNPEPTNGTYNLYEYTYVGTGGNAPAADFGGDTVVAAQWNKSASTTQITVDDNDVAKQTTDTRDVTPNGPSRAISNPDYQIGVQDLVYINESDTTGATGLEHHDGNVCLTYLKSSSTAYIAYLRITGLASNTGWDVYQTEFDDGV